MSLKGVFNRATGPGSGFPGVLKRIGSVADRLGMKVYAVGGYIRDLLLSGKEDYRDLDLTVIGDSLVLAKELRQELGARILVIYERFGTAMLEVDSYKLELVTGRKEMYLPASRKPIVKQAGLESELARRDFSINALAVGLNRNTLGTFYDPFNGLKDLHNRVIRTPLDPRTTFGDDPLRILRAVRFASVLDFCIEQRTQEAIQGMVHRLKMVSNERISDELFKIIGRSKPPSKGVLLMDSLGILPHVLPEINEMKGVEQRKDFHHKDAFHHSLNVMDDIAEVSNKLELRLAALFHDVGKPSTKRFDDMVGWTFHCHDEVGAEMMTEIARRLRLSKATKSYIQKLIRLHLRPIFLALNDVTDSAIRRMIVQAGDELDDLFQLCRADITSGHINGICDRLKNFERLKDRVTEVREKDKLHGFQSPVRGDKIMQICRIPAGPLVGKMKKEIEEAILDGKIPNDYQAALAYLHEIKKWSMDKT
ncbi:MAG: HD domain-containing protein [Syntrophaceae bacterium]|nr:HD domain-containing protein [Syntrophaceae bacterium]